MYYYRARYYDAKVGRFISQDPIGFAGGDVNLYSYVGQNPVNFKDPTGEAVPAAIGIRIGAWVLPRIGAIFFFPPLPDNSSKDDLRRANEETKCLKAFRECILGCIKCPGQGGPEEWECINKKCVPEHKRCLARIK